jgi:leader peptidase (prepilin peptidase)/N-methyltransferase
MIAAERALTQRPLPSRSESRLRIGLIAVAFSALGAALYLAAANHLQATDEVRPTEFGFVARRLFHHLLIGLILVATVVDWDGYTIPDQITIPGMLLGLTGAFAIGHAQLVHLWVDWSQALPGLAGPYFPEWFKFHHHWHGLAWSAAGLVVGAGLTWLVRCVSSWVLGCETLGFGDVTLMAMIGSFLGWQPTVMAFVIAPLVGLVVGIPIKLLTNKPYIPYGPFLGTAAILVMLGWGLLWYRMRNIFGDAGGLLMLAAIAGGGFVLLLGLLIAYRRIPTRDKRQESRVESQQ